jgi:dihydroxyacid dehydratase/phosphogluconate dehydratase
MFGVTALIYSQQMGEVVALVTDGRFSGATRAAMLRRRRRSAAARAGARRRHRAHRRGRPARAP